MFRLLTRAAMALALVMAAALPLSTAQAQTGDPAIATVQNFYDALLASMKGGKALGANGRYTKMRAAVDQAFDIGTMIKYAVGEGWATASPADQKALTEAFDRMTAAQYAGNFDSFNGEKFVVDPNVQVRGTDHYVSSKLVTSDQTVTFIYRLRQFGSQWKIIDVLLDGNISQLSVYRSDFSATMKSGGASALVKKIDALSDKALKG
ncbi:MAG: ABC transporter substrate-binding protein [Proteobacteria bacterium]|nr:ABC transporter substrate-binding protein [Pseudomonadota bacterium]